MAIKESEYFEYTIPALTSLFSGMLIFNKDVNLRDVMNKIDTARAFRLGTLLLFISFSVDLILPLGITQIKSISSFTHYFRYGAALCYLLSPSSKSYLLIAFIFSIMIIDVLATGLFHDLFVWPAFMFFIYGLRKKLSFGLRLLPIFFIIPLLIVVQAVKFQYREITWRGNGKGISTIVDLADKQNKEERLFSDESSGVISTVGRLNQGWHLGLVLRRVPRSVPFSEGKDFTSDLEGIILPRIFYPEKKVIGSKEKFEKFTGHKIEGNTSMTIGVLGDFYVNFGREGSYLLLFFLGLIISKFLHWFIIRYVIVDPVNIIWLPLLFNFVIRANNDFYMLANSLFKGFILFLIINYIFNRWK